jgi:hypothetical protein
MSAQAIGLGHDHNNQEEAPTGRTYSLYVIGEGGVLCPPNLLPPRWGF